MGDSSYVCVPVGPARTRGRRLGPQQAEAFRAVKEWIEAQDREPVGDAGRCVVQPPVRVAYGLSPPAYQTRVSRIAIRGPNRPGGVHRSGDPGNGDSNGVLSGMSKFVAEEPWGRGTR